MRGRFIGQLLSLSLVLALGSCKKFLTLAPPSSATDASFYKTTQDITNALNGCYAALQDKTQYQDHFVTMMEARSDNVSDNNAAGNAGLNYNIDRFLAGSNNTVFLEAWQSIYNTIYRCNETLAHLDVVTDATLKRQYEGELRFLRALEYFNAVRFWGDVPLVLTPVSTDGAYQLARNKQADVYASIEQDLSVASSFLPLTFSGADIGRATKGAAQTLLAKVYLTEQKYNAVTTVLDSVIHSGVYQLLPHITDVFSTANKMNQEVVFAVRFNKSIAGQGHAIPAYFDDPILDPALLSAYPVDDSRRDLLTTTASGSHKPVKKYFDVLDSATNTVGNDFLLLRYADVYLMAAEALNEQGYDAAGDAMNYLDSVRSRAMAPLFTAAELPDQASFRSAVLQERRLEFPLEWQRWFDLTRTNTATQALKALNLNIQSWQYLYPVPLTEVNIINNARTFPQNPNY